jgi:hypothetical protein
LALYCGNKNSARILPVINQETKSSRVTSNNRSNISVCKVKHPEKDRIGQAGIRHLTKNKFNTWKANLDCCGTCPQIACAQPGWPEFCTPKIKIIYSVELFNQTSDNKLSIERMCSLSDNVSQTALMKINSNILQKRN